MNRYTERKSHMPKLALGMTALFLLSESIIVGTTAARELMAPKEQRETEYDQIEAPSMDEQRRGRPQSMFVWIQMAKGYEIEWDTFGRQGWYTQDPRVKPIEPGTTVFTPDTPAIYIVFEAAPQEDPGQFSAQWFLEEEDGKIAEKPLGRDVLELPGHSRWGYLELKSPPSGWPKGNYLVKIFITPLGQQAFHAVNQVGTMRFKVTDQPVTVGTSTPK
jgi:hypothetical protein